MYSRLRTLKKKLLCQKATGKGLTEEWATFDLYKIIPPRVYDYLQQVIYYQRKIQSKTRLMAEDDM